MRVIILYMTIFRCSKMAFLYRVSPKKQNGGFSVPCDLKVSYFFTALNEASSAEENDTKIIEFGWVILILCPFLDTQSFQISLDFSHRWAKFVGNGLSYVRFRLRRIFCWHGSMGFPKHHMKGLSRYNSTLIGRKNQAKYENDCVSRNGHKIKIQPNSMILVSFSSAEDSLFNDVKNDSFSLQSTENQPLRFLGETRYIWAVNGQVKQFISYIQTTSKNMYVHPPYTNLNTN